MKLTIEYDSDHGYLYADGRAEEWIDSSIKLFLKQKKNWHIKVCSALLVDFFRLKVCEGKIDVDQIEFVFKGEVLKHNKYGSIEHWPDGFCDIPIYPMERLLILASDMLKKEKKLRMMSKDNELAGIQDVNWKNN